MEITIPGALADFLAGTNLATGADDHDPVSKATREALDAGRRGRGRTLIIRPTIDVLHVISEYAETLLAPGVETTVAERRAARLWIERAGHAPHTPAAEEHQEQAPAAPTIEFELTATGPAATPHQTVRNPRGVTRTLCGTRTYVRLGATDRRICQQCDRAHAVVTAGPVEPEQRHSAGARGGAAHLLIPGRTYGYCGKELGTTPATGGRVCRNCTRLAELVDAFRAEVADWFPATEQQLDAVEAEEAAHFAAATRKLDAVEHAESVEAAVETVAEAEAVYAAELVTEAEATDGTWRGEWIGQQADDGLFVLEPAVEQGALFDDRAAAPAVVEVALDRVDTVAPEVTRASVDAYLAREYPALFASAQPRPAELEPAHLWAVEHRVMIRGDWQGLAMCGMSRKEADDRADVLRATGSRAVAVVKCWHGPHAHPDERTAARCQGCGYRIPTGTDWHDACRPRPRPTPLERARRAAARDAGYARALDASDRVADLDGEPPF